MSPWRLDALCVYEARRHGRDHLGQLDCRSLSLMSTRESVEADAPFKVDVWRLECCYPVLCSRSMMSSMRDGSTVRTA